MLFKEVLGQDPIKTRLIESVDRGRIAHAQLFVGPEGSGVLPIAIAYARYVICKNTDSDALERACSSKFENMSHPDLHFAFPVATSSKVKKHPVSKHYLEAWRGFLKAHPYAGLFDWYKWIAIDNKQGQIGVDEAQEMVKALSLKSYEGGYKVMLVWMPEKMHVACANSLLKCIEEPPQKTVFILVAEDENQIIDTITSRCQILHFPPLSEAVIQQAVIKNYNVEVEVAATVARQADGSYNRACQWILQNAEGAPFETWLVVWIRTAFKAKKHPSAVRDLMSWSGEISKTGRETQKQFLLFCMSFFRQALLLNYGVTALVYWVPKTTAFKLENFAPFVHGCNILEITEVLQEALYHIERNGSPKIILTDVSIKLTRLLHKNAE